MSQHPYEKLVEALRETNGFGWVQTDRTGSEQTHTWRCSCCGAWARTTGGYNPTVANAHAHGCVLRLALEAAPPTMPKLERIHQLAAKAYMAAESDTESEAIAEKILDAVKEIMQEPQAMTAQQPEPVTRGEVDELRDLILDYQSKTHAHFFSVNGIIERLQHRLGTLEARQPQTPEPKPKCEPNHHCGDVFGVKCNRCLDTKIIKHHTDTDQPALTKLCPCVKVGDVVSAEVVNLLGDESKIASIKLPATIYTRRLDHWHIDGSPATLEAHICDGDWCILRIGPAPATDVIAGKARKMTRTHPTLSAQLDAGAEACKETTDARGWVEHSRSADGKVRYQCQECEVISRELDNGIPPAHRHLSVCTSYKPRDDVPDKAEDHFRDAAKKAEPNLAYDIARDCIDAYMGAPDDGDKDRRAVEAVLRKHGVSQPIPLADLIADPRLRPVVEVVRAVESAYVDLAVRDKYRSIRIAVDALPPELRAAIEAVK